jgi:hypothetical protein
MKTINLIILFSLINFPVFGLTDEEAGVVTDKIEKNIAIDSAYITKHREEYAIDSKYRSGSYLIYDCEDNHFACVNNESFDRCTEKREIDKKENLNKYRCTPIKNFSNKEECLKENYKIQQKAILKKFCYKGN